MPRRSPRELEHELSQLRSGAGTAGTAEAGDVSVTWRDAAPDERPEGMSWNPDEGVLAYDLWGAQQDTRDVLDEGDADAADHDLDIAAFLGGFGSGKSVFGARWIIAQALDFPGSRFLAMGVDFQKARNTTYPKLFAALPGERTTLTTSGFNGPESSPIIADFNRQEYRLTFNNGSVITLGSADKASRYAGAEFGAVWNDEPSLYNNLHDLTDMLTTRLRGVDGPKVQLWTLTGNGYNAAWEILEKREDADGDPIGLNIEVIRAATENNPYLDSGEIARFKRKHAGTAKAEQALRGGFSAAQGLVYSGFSRDVHVIAHADAVDRVAGGWRILGYDAGWNDPRVLLEIGRTSYDQLVVLDEFYESGSHVEDAIAWLEENKKPRGKIYAEHEPADIQKFERAGYQATKAEKSIDAGISEVRDRLELDDEERPGLLISEQCENLIRELQGYKEEHVGKSHASDHCVDSLRYAIQTESVDGGPRKRVTRHRSGRDSRGQRKIIRRKSGETTVEYPEESEGLQ